MKELTHNQIARINRLELLRFRRDKRTAVQKWDRFMAFIALSFAFLILACVLIVKLEWSPGEQERIFQAYKAQRHEAVELVANR